VRAHQRGLAQPSFLDVSGPFYSGQESGSGCCCRLIISNQPLRSLATPCVSSMSAHFKPPIVSSLETTSLTLAVSSSWNDSTLSFLSFHVPSGERSQMPGPLTLTCLNKRAESC